MILIIFITILVFAGGCMLGYVALEMTNNSNKRIAAISGSSRSKSVGKISSKQKMEDLRTKLEEIDGGSKGQKVKFYDLKSRAERAGFADKFKNFLIVGAVVAFVTFMIPVYGGFSPLIGLVLAPLTGFLASIAMINFMIARRRKKFLAEFPDALDIIVRGVKSGLPLNDCLQLIAKETEEPLKSEFRDLVDTVATGISIEDAMDRFYQRNPLPEVNFFRVVIVLQQKSGGSLSEVLMNLSNVLRGRKQLREKIKALSSEAKASALIIGCLPPGVAAIVSFTTPSYMMLLFTDPKFHGQTAVFLGLCWMGIGIFMMHRMINFKV